MSDLLYDEDAAKAEALVMSIRRPFAAITRAIIAPRLPMRWNPAQRPLSS
jgi:hypothetical protein